MKGRRGDNGHGKVDEFVDFIETARQRAADESSPDFIAGPTEPLMPGGDLPDLRPLLVGYEILERIDRGGQAVVYRAVQAKPRRQVAIKIMLGGATASADQRRRFESEVEVISRLQHPNLVTIFDSKVVNNCYFYTMPFVDGARIDDHVLLHDRTVEQIVGLMIKVCRAINHCHQKGVIHRDIKPSNIIVDGNGEPHVLDFGLARDMGAKPDASRTYSISGQVIGTLYYLSPEQAAGRSKSADTRTDVYGLGLTLFQLLTQQFPYDVEGSPEEVRQRIIDDPPRSVQRALLTSTVHSKLRSEVSGSAGVLSDVDAVIRRALEKEPERRYQTAALLAEDLERCLRGEPVTAREGNRVYRMRKWVRRHRVGAMVGGVVLASLVGTIVSVTLAWRRAEGAARMYRDGLHSAGLLLAGKDSRNDVHLDQAMELFEKAAALMAHSDIKDRDFLCARIQVDAEMMRLMSRTAGLFDMCRFHDLLKRIDATVAMLPADTPDTQWAHGTALHMHAVFEQTCNHRGAATPYAEAALALYEQVLRSEPEPSLESLARVARMHAVISREANELGLVCESLPHHCAAIEIGESMVRASPRRGDGWIILAQGLQNLEVWHKMQSTDEDDRTARELLDYQKSMLISVGNAGWLAARGMEVFELVRDNDTNRAALNRRTAAARRGDPKSDWRARLRTFGGDPDVLASDRMKSCAESKLVSTPAH